MVKYVLWKDYRARVIFRSDNIELNVPLFEQQHRAWITVNISICKILGMIFPAIFPKIDLDLF